MKQINDNGMEIIHSYIVGVVIIAVTYLLILIIS
jgi:hypothetical protein